MKRLAAKTINNHLSAAGQVFKFVRDEHGVELDNPFYRTRYGKRAVMEAPERKERLLDDNDLELLFTSPLFSGCKSKHRRWEPGPQIIKDALYWVPLLEAFAGLRLEEASQLRVKDVRSFFGTPWLVIGATEGRHVKSSAGNRCVPLHRFLAELGFLQYVQEMAQAGKDRLFPELSADTRGTLGGISARSIRAIAARSD